MLSNVCVDKRYHNKCLNKFTCPLCYKIAKFETLEYG